VLAREDINTFEEQAVAIEAPESAGYGSRERLYTRCSLADRENDYIQTSLLSTRPNRLSGLVIDPRQFRAGLDRMSSRVKWERAVKSLQSIPHS
jgi:hypothetical protein